MGLGSFGAMCGRGEFCALDWRALDWCDVDWCTLDWCAPD